MQTNTPKQQSREKQTKAKPGAGDTLPRLCYVGAPIRNETEASRTARRTKWRPQRRLGVNANTEATAERAASGHESRHRGRRNPRHKTSGRWVIDLRGGRTIAAVALELTQQRVRPDHTSTRYGPLGLSGSAKRVGRKKNNTNIRRKSNYIFSLFTLCITAVCIPGIYL